MPLGGSSGIAVTFIVGNEPGVYLVDTVIEGTRVAWRRGLLRSVLICSLLLGQAYAVLAQGPTRYYVATNGNDNWSGTREAPVGNDGPFRTLARARAVVRTGQVIAHGDGIHLSRSSGSIVSRNLVHDTPRFSIELSGGTGLLIATNNTIEFNDVSRANLDSQDAGPLYTWSAGPGTVIHNNRVHDSDMPFSFGQGIYLDGDSKQATVVKNVVHDLQQRVSDAVTFSGIQCKGPQFRILNNIVANNRFSAGDLRTNRSDGEIVTRDGEILRNIFYRNGTAHIYHLAQWEESHLRVTDYNLFFQDGGAYDVGFGFTLGGGPGRFETLSTHRGALPRAALAWSRSGSW